jgi:hypothetical protein
MKSPGQLLDRAAEKTISAAGNAAGATVDPSTGLQKAASVAMRPGVLVALMLAAVAYVVGRRSAS